MQKEPEYYGRARYVNEGPKPVNNFKYLEDITYDELFLTGTRAFHRRDIPLERAADEAMEKKYLKLVGLWIRSADKREPDLGYEFYLTGLSEIVRLGVNNHPQELTALWPHIKKKADMLNAELRLTPNCPARRQYEDDCKIVEGLKELLELEMMTHE